MVMKPGLIYGRIFNFMFHLNVYFNEDNFMINTNTTQKDWEDFWENEDKSFTPSERELFESSDDDRSISQNYVNDVINGKTTLLKRESPLSE